MMSVPYMGGIRRCGVDCHAITAFQMIITQPQIYNFFMNKSYEYCINDVYSNSTPKQTLKIFDDMRACVKKMMESNKCTIIDIFDRISSLKLKSKDERRYPFDVRKFDDAGGDYKHILTFIHDATGRPISYPKVDISKLSTLEKYFFDDWKKMQEKKCSVASVNFLPYRFVGGDNPSITDEDINFMVLSETGAMTTNPGDYTSYVSIIGIPDAINEACRTPDTPDFSKAIQRAFFHECFYGNAVVNALLYAPKVLFVHTADALAIKGGAKQSAYAGSLESIIPEHLDIDEYLTEPFKRGKPYRLTAFAVYNNGIHYYAYVHRNNKWYKCDDVSVLEVNFSSIMITKNTIITCVIYNIEY